MIIGKRIISLVTVAVIVVCMSGYIRLIPELLDMHKIIPVARVEDGVDDSEDILITTGENQPQSFLALKSLAEKGFNEVAFKYSFIEVHGVVQKVLGRRLIIGASQRETVKLNNGHLVRVRRSPGSNIENNAYNTVELHEYLLERNIEFLYVNAPHALCMLDNQLPEGVMDYINSDASIFLSVLNQNNVPNVDLREVLHTYDLDHYSLFFITDHHWTPEAGLWASGYVMNQYFPQFLRDDVDVFDTSNYNFTVEQNMFLGSCGRSVGRVYGGIDDISIITPKFISELHVVSPFPGVEKSGTFMETCIADITNDLYNVSQYDQVYVGGNPGVRIYNADGNGKKMLVIGCSFARVFVPFLGLNFSETFLYDQRYVSGSAVEHIAKFQPDIVIVFINSEYADNSDLYDFGITRQP